MKRLLVAEAWGNFTRAVLPVDVSPVQRQEMRRAFYAGALGVLDALGDASAAGDRSEEGLINDVRAEFLQYAVDLKRGRG